jgi:hypothetical protein
MPFKVWAIGEEVLAADFQPYLQNQVVAAFPSTAARDAAITAPVLGQMAVITAAPFPVQVFDGTAWRNLGAPHVEARLLNVTINANAQGVINHVRPFTAPPILLVWSAAQGGGQAAYIFTPMAGATASSFTVFVWSAAGAGANVPNVTVGLFVVAMEAQT